MKPPTPPTLHVILADIHYPDHSPIAVEAVFRYIAANKSKIASVTLLGDALDCQNLSRHTVGKPRLRKRGGYKQDIDGFQKHILDRIEAIVKPGTKKTFICGNHENWIQSDLLDAMPELEGTVDLPLLLKLKERGWKWIPCGGHIKIGKAVLIHGDQIGSGTHVAKKMIDQLADSCVMGHVHSTTSFTRSSRLTAKRKWIGHTLGCLCNQSPGYAKGRPNAFNWGFGVLEVWGAEQFTNIHSLVIMPNGKFSFGGIVY